MAESLSKTVSKPAAPQARLILQDPLAFDQATQPALRSSLEMTAEPTAVLEREKARELWESLSLEPELAQERQSERKRLLSRAEQLAQETAAAKAQALELQAQLAKARDERLNHPLVYAGAAGLLGIGALWWLERRKRLQLEERELEMHAQQSPSLMQDEEPSYLHEPHDAFSLEDSPDLATDFATDLPGLTGMPSYSEKMPESMKIAIAPSQAITRAPASTSASAQEFAAPPLSSDLAMPDWAQPLAAAKADSKVNSAPTHLPSEEELVAVSRSEKEGGLLSMSKRVLGNMLRRKSEREAGISSLQASHYTSTAMLSTSTHSSLIHQDSEHDATQMLFDEEAQLAYEQELLEQQLQAGLAGSTDLSARYDPDQANIELLSQTRISPHRGESAIEHLLELRTAVTGLCVLGRPEGAARLLEEHITSDPGTCAWAYLEYMHICEQIGKRDDFELMRKQYRIHFNRMAPYWHEPNANVLGLDGYARAANELCAAWTQGRTHALHTIAMWLAGPLLGRKLVQLPAYHDLFDLYEMLEIVDSDTNPARASSAASGLSGVQSIPVLNNPLLAGASNADSSADQEFVPTVSLLDLDYEFSSDVTLQEREVQESEKAVTVVKTGNFSVDFNVAGTQMGALQSMPAELGKK